MVETDDDNVTYKKTRSTKMFKAGSGLTEYDRRMLSKFFSLGFEFAGVVSLFAFFGYKADQYFGTLPWLTVAFIVTALTGLIYQLIKDLDNLN